LGLQPHPRKHFHFQLGACQHRYPTTCLDTTLSRRGRDQVEPGRPHRFWDASASDCHPDPRPAWLPAKPGTALDARRDQGATHPLSTSLPVIEDASHDQLHILLIPFRIRS